MYVVTKQCPRKKMWLKLFVTTIIGKNKGACVCIYRERELAKAFSGMSDVITGYSRYLVGYSRF
jgi:hypothetical protein